MARGRQRQRAWIVLGLVGALAASMLIGACGEDEAAGGSSRVQVSRGDGDEAPYGGDDRVVIVAGEDTYVVTGDPGEECVELEDGEECIVIGDVQERYCDEEGAQADIIVVEGEVVDVICYPPDDDGTPIEEVARDGEGNVEVPQNQNGAVVIFDEETNGEPIEGDVKLEAERTTIYGNGIDETILDGNVTIESNNSRIRGLTITGDLNIEKTSNNAAVAFCKVYGKLTVDSNGVTVANCQVFGDVKVTGNNVVLINIGAGAGWEVSNSTWCDGCYSFDDADDDHEIIEDEVGDPLSCPGAPPDGVVIDDNNDDDNNDDEEVTDN